jgi:hypothetical protein
MLFYRKIFIRGENVDLRINTGSVSSPLAPLTLIAGTLALMVLTLGFFALAGCSAQSSPSPTTTLSDGVQVVETEFESGRYVPITVQAGIPVRWIIRIDEEDINGCNRTLVVSEYGLQLDLKPGENILEFTPEATGDVGYSCWMGMIRSTITVVDDIERKE